MWLILDNTLIEILVYVKGNKREFTENWLSSEETFQKWFSYADICDAGNSNAYNSSGIFIQRYPKYTWLCALTSPAGLFSSNQTFVKTVLFRVINQKTIIYAAFMYSGIPLYRHPLTDGHFCLSHGKYFSCISFRSTHIGKFRQNELFCDLPDKLSLIINLA